MNINSDINILGGLPDFNLITHFLFEPGSHSGNQAIHHTYTSIKTDKSVKRFERAINGTFLNYSGKESEYLIKSIIGSESISQNSLLMLFWSASQNNDLFKYLTTRVYFTAFYSGRLIIKTDEVEACIKELRETEESLKGWSANTIHTVSYKYLTLLKKLNLMEDGLNKKILHPYLSDKMFVLFIYWLKSIETKPNLLESSWLKYCFCEQPVFIDRVLQKKFAEFYQLTYTGDQLKIETSLPYENIYYAIK